MEFENQFDVPVGADEAWKILLDIESIAPCVPGAKLTEIVDGKTYKGTISVKLGPVALTFNGRTSFENIDEAERSAQLIAQGNDTKGRGGANAKVKFHIKNVDGGARVFISTNLQLSGSVAQYGRGVGMIKDLAQQIIDQFSENLRKNVITPSIEPGEQGSAPQSAAPAQVGSIGLRVLWNAILRKIKTFFKAQ
jgi:carbon monoxide dehydrogenase subunit G